MKMSEISSSIAGAFRLSGRGDPNHPLARSLRSGLAAKYPTYTAEENHPDYRFGPEAPDQRALQRRWRRFVQRNLQHFARTWDRLEDDESRQVMLECLLFRVLGWEKIKRRRNTPEYQLLARALPESSDRFPILESRVRKVRHKFMHVHDIPELGLKLATTDGFLLNVIQNQQYCLRRPGKAICVDPGDVVLDCGTGWGDTALFFAQVAGPDGRVFTFDFAPGNRLTFQKNLSLNPQLSERTKFVEAAVGETSGAGFSFDDQGSTSHVHAADGQRRATTIAIDDFVSEQGLESVDFIKMDIEGAEKGAIRGARRTLLEMMPKLAICVYHKLDDLYAIPDLISEIQPAYRFWLDHHTIHGEETVLYADARG